MTMKTTMGELMADLFSEFERVYRDKGLTAVATQVALDELMAASKRSDAGSRKAA